MAEVKVQRLTGTIAGSTVSVAASAFDSVSSLSNAFAIPVDGIMRSAGRGTTTAGAIRASLATAKLTSTSALTFERGFSTTSVCECACDLWEYTGSSGGPNEFVVRAILDITILSGSLTADSTAISGIVSLGNCVPFIFNRTASSIGEPARFAPLAEVINNGTDNVVRLTRRQSTADVIAVVYVVEFVGSNWTVQKVTHSFTTDDTNEDETISSVGAISNAFVYTTATAAINRTVPVNYNWWVWLANATTLRFRANDRASSDDTAISYVVSNPQLSVQWIGAPDGTADWVSSGTAPETKSETVSAVSALNAASVIGNAGSDYAVNDSDGWTSVIWFFGLTSTTNVDAIRSRSAGSTERVLQVIDFGGLVSAITLLVADLSHGHDLAGVSLTQASALSVADLAHASTLDATVLTQAHTLSAADLLQAHSLDATTVDVAYALVPDDAVQAHTLEALALTQANTLSISDLAQAHPLGEVLLTQAGTLGVNDLAHAHTLDAPGLTQAHTLAAADLSQAHTLDVLQISQTGTLGVSDLAHAHSLDAVIITQASSLTPSDLTQAHTLDAVAITQTSALVLSHLLHAHSLDSVSLTQAHTLIAQDVAQTHSLDAVALSQAYTVVLSDLLHAHTFDGVVLTQANVLATQDLTHAHTLDASSLMQANVLAAADLTHAHTLDHVMLSQGDVLGVNDLAQAQTLDTVVVTQAHVLEMADLLHAHSLDTVMITAASALITADIAHAHDLYTVELTQASFLAVVNLLQAHTLDEPSVDVSHLLSVDDLRQTHTLDSGIELSHAVTLMVNDLLHQQILDAVSLRGPGTGEVLMIPTHERLFLVAPNERRILVPSQERITVIAPRDRTHETH